MPGTQELTRRIKSVRSTRKITRALQMVSASKMRKAQNATLTSRSYTELAWELVQSVSLRATSSNEGRGNLNSDDEIASSVAGSFLAMTNVDAMMTINPKATKVAVVVISSNKGMVGSFNTNLILKLRDIEKENQDTPLELIVIGKKAADATARMKKNIVAQFQKMDSKETVEGVYPIAQKITAMFASKEYQKVLVVYNHFVSTLVQKATVKQLLPFGVESEKLKVKSEETELKTEYEFEPSPEIVINHLLPRIIESQLYQAILESDASEHSARMVMMKNATDAAADLIDDLTLTFNQLRQGKITTELSEITAGRIALEK